MSSCARHRAPCSMLAAMRAARHTPDGRMRMRAWRARASGTHSAARMRVHAWSTYSAGRPGVQADRRAGSCTADQEHALHVRLGERACTLPHPVPTIADGFQSCNGQTLQRLQEQLSSVRSELAGPSWMLPPPHAHVRLGEEGACVHPAAPSSAAGPGWMPMPVATQRAIRVL